MGIIRSQALNNSVVSYLGIIIGYLNLAILFPRLLSQEVLGLVQVLVAAMLFTSNLGSFGLQYIVVRYFPIFRNKAFDTRTFFSFAFTLSVGFILISSLILFTFRASVKAFYTEKAELFADYYYLLFPLLVFGILSILLDSYSRAIMKSVLTATYKEVVLRILQLCSVLLFYFELLSLDQFLWLYVLTQGAYVIIMYIAVGKHSDIKFNFNFKPIKKPFLKDIFKYGGISMFSTTSLLANNSDVLLVGTFVGLEATAIYSVASAIGRVIGVPSRSLVRVATSVVAEAWSTNDTGRIERVYKKSAFNNLITGGVLFLLVAINTPLFLSLIPESYAAAEPVIVILALSKIVQTASGIGSSIISSSRDYRVNMIVNTLSFAALLGLSYLFISIFGMIGAAYGTFLTMFMSNMAKYLFLKTKYKLEPFSMSFLWIVVLLTSIYFIDFALPHLDHLVIDSIARSIILTGFYVVIIYKSNWSSDFNELIEEQILNRIK
ncbi:MAG: polysaccharide biosynthesis C-terminal domain-containing protein [Salibacteraceae bacterium]